MSRNAYTKYKPSGVEWLGEIPEHWGVKPLKRTLSILNGATPKSGDPDYWDGDIPWATPDDLGSLSGDTLMKTRRMITQEGYHSCGTSLAPCGSLVLSTRAPIGHLAIAGIPLCTNQGCRCLVFREKVENRFYYYQLLGAKHELESWGQGSTFRELGRDRLAAFYLASPPIDEQRAIATFLDHEAARIEALIEKKQKQIELLRERRTTLISHAVTKGIHHSVKMKDSGIDWLGEIPENWSVVRLRFHARINPSRAEINSLPGDTQVSFVPMEAVCEYGGLILDQTKSISEASTGYTYFREGDVVVAKITPCFENGKGSIADRLENGLGFGTTELHVLRPLTGLDHRFLFYLTISHAFRNIGTAYMYGAGGQKRVPDDFIRDFRQPLPPVDIQHAIASYLDRETARIDTMTEKISTSINMLREYRTALISAAVTGKIDVRGKTA